VIHQPNEPIPVPEETLEWAAQTLRKTKFAMGQAFGLAVDDMFKHKAMRELSCTIPPKFAHYDLQMGDLYLEVKSTSGLYFTFSAEEYKFMRGQVFINGGQYKVLFYVNDLEVRTTTFIGSLDASYIFDEGLFQGSYTLANEFLGYYIERLHVEKALTQV
jgi:hypothetical protein